MKNYNREILLIVLTAIGAFTNMKCGNFRSNHETSNGLTGRNWKLIQLTATPAVDWDLDGKPDTDIFTLMDECERDDLKYFKTDHAVITYPGKMKCEEEDQQPVTGTWTYNENEQVLTLSEQDVVTKYQLLSMNSDRLTLLYNFEKTNGDKHQITAVYEAIP